MGDCRWSQQWAERRSLIGDIIAVEGYQPGVQGAGFLSMPSDLPQASHWNTRVVCEAPVDKLTAVGRLLAMALLLNKSDIR